MTVLELRSLSVHNGKTVIDNGNLNLYPGQVTGLLGPNGSGKTTLLRAVCGVLPYTGKILWNGEDLARLGVRGRARVVTAMTQEPPEGAGITVSEYCSFGMYAADRMFSGFSRIPQKTEARLRALAAHFDMTALLSKDLSRMSVGERQMASLLRVALQDTPVVLFDEPTGALDPSNAGRVLAYLRECAEAGKTVLCVLHDPAAALTVCDTLVLLQNGTLSEPFPCADAQPETAEKFLSALAPGMRVGRTGADGKSGFWYCCRDPFYRDETERTEKP